MVWLCVKDDSGCVSVWILRTWKEVVEADMKSLKLSNEDAVVHGKWRRLIRGTEEDSGDSGS